MKENVFISKKMSYALRHNPQKYHLKLDKYGYTDLQHFIFELNQVHHFHPALSESKIRQVMAQSSKERFRIKNGKIAALYGHSIPGIISHRQATPPSVLYHGTARRFIPSIQKLGLLPMGRQYVHLSTDTKMATQVGARHDNSPVILKIDTVAALKNGIKFYVGNDEVWLVDELPPQYIKFPTKKE